MVGWPARRTGGIAAELAEANSARNPARTASTAAALMIGLTLVTVVAVLGAGLRSSVEHAVTDQVHAPYVLAATEGVPFPAAEGDALAETPGVKAYSHVRDDQALVGKDELAVTGVDPDTIERFYRFDWTDGSAASVAALADHGALVDQDVRRQASRQGRHAASRSRHRRASGMPTRCAASTTRRSSTPCSAT